MPNARSRTHGYIKERKEEGRGELYVYTVDKDWLRAGLPHGALR